MYGTIIIKTAAAQAQFKTWAHDSIYAFLTDHGYSHDTAADVAAGPTSPRLARNMSLMVLRLLLLINERSE